MSGIGLELGLGLGSGGYTLPAQPDNGLLADNGDYLVDDDGAWLTL